MSKSRQLSRFLAAVPILAFTALISCTAEPVSTNTASPPATATSSQAATLVGQLLLPGEGGRRGVELDAWVTAPDGELNQLWLLPDADGRFAHGFSGELTRVSVSAGSEVHRIDAVDLPRADDNGRVDLGAIDLRESLVAYRVRTRAGDGATGGVVRMGLWIGPPQTGPLGSLPSLGSKQFPPLELGSEVEWLLPPGISAVYLLVERTDGPGHTTNWRGGKQQLFGPYESSMFPLELVLN